MAANYLPYYLYYYLLTKANYGHLTKIKKGIIRYFTYSYLKKIGKEYNSLNVKQ